MKTLSLVHWKRNENMSNIYVSALDGNSLFLKHFYADVFRGCAEILKCTYARSASFTDIWTSACDNACNDVNEAISNELSSRGIQASAGAVQRVVDKFRGNLGEIMVEMLAENGILDFIKPGTYEPVDPTKEEFVDATGLRNGMPVGIQVKNYTKFNRVSQEVFLKAAAMSDIWLRRDNAVPDGCLEMFVSTPCQYIVSTSLPDNACLEDRFKGSVVFLGPKWLDSRKIQGSSKTKESPKWKMFEEVAEMVERLEA